jgi:hypothetical protein
MKTLVLRVPLIMMFGDGITICPWLVLIRWEVRESQRKHLIPHELCHVEQMRRDGWFTFMRRYLTNQKERLAYEVAAYKVSVANGMYIYEAARALTKYYIYTDDGTPLTLEHAKQLLEVTNV